MMPPKKKSWQALKAGPVHGHCGKIPGWHSTPSSAPRVSTSPAASSSASAIARAFLKNAPILILDEATAFADPDNEAKVQTAFAELAKGRTVIMIAHRLSTVANADCIYVVEDGRIAESGTRDALCAKSSIFAKMWQDYAIFRSVEGCERGVTI